MRSLTPTLLAAQKAASSTPYVKVEVHNRIGGVVRCEWSRLYSGTEDDCFHGVTVAGDGSLVRARTTPPSDSGKLYRQRVAAPGPGSDFGQWTYTGQYNAVRVAVASLGAEVSIFWIKTNREIRRIVSADSGATWGAPELIGYTPTVVVNGLAAANRPDGDLAIFFADQSILYVQKRVDGEWQARSAWDKSTGDLSGVACLYDGDWELLVTGEDSSGNCKLWSLAYGDGGRVSTGQWSVLRELASAPSDGDFEYAQPYLDKPDVYRCFFVERFAGTESYARPFWSHTVPGSDFADGLWREPVPFNLSSEHGLAMAHHGDYGWLSNPSGVWRAGLAPQSLDLTPDVTGARFELAKTAGSLTVQLRNDDGRYASPGQGELAILAPGAALDFSPGYVTAAGQETNAGPGFRLEAIEHASSGGQASLVLHAQDGWAALAGWHARYQFRWNRASEEMSVAQIVAFVLARVGIKLEAMSQSSLMTDFYPDFTIGADDDGLTVIRKLLSFVPDLLFIEGDTAYIVNPLSTDASVYSYGPVHAIQEGAYRNAAMEASEVQVEGYDAGSGTPVLVTSFAWDEIGRLNDRSRQIEDRNLGTSGQVGLRGEACLRKAEIARASGHIVAAVNCGQQLYDVVDITDPRAGLAGEKRRVLGLLLVYDPRRGEYRQRLQLGAP